MMKRNKEQIKFDIKSLRSKKGKVKTGLIITLAVILLLALAVVVFRDQIGNWIHMLFDTGTGGPGSMIDPDFSSIIITSKCA